MITEKKVYDGPGGPFEGYICYDDSHDDQRPLVLVSHAYGGQSEFDIEKAQLLAEMGYVGFAIDMYGQGRRAKSPDEASALMAQLLADRVLLSERINNSLKVGRQHLMVDASRVGAIGFCFGGKCVLDLARSGAPLAGVVSFHGILDAPEINYTDPISTKVLVCHGWNDPLATPLDVIEFSAEMSERQADWQLLAFGNVGHSFTNPAVDRRDEGYYYDENAHRRSWRVMEGFFAEVFA